MIKLHTSTNSQYYFTLCGKNGKVIATSETYKTKQGRMKGVKALLKAAQIAIDEIKILKVL